MDEIMNVISTIGFPMAISVYLLISAEKQRQEARADSERWCEAINKNTNVIEKLMDKLD